MTSDIEAEVDRQIEVMHDGASALYGEEELRVRLAGSLRSGKPLRVKLGMDPSSPDLHLGHTVVLQKLKKIQDLGHTPIFLIGDFTARIGDPSGKKKTRPALDADQVKSNARTYVEQVGKVLDVSRAEVRFNSEWMEGLAPSDFVRLCSHYTVARLLERDDFSKRYKEGEAIAVHEFLYPFVQSYDSVALEADIELGGTDQTFNLLMAREIQRNYGQSPQAAITHPLLVGTDGVEKMSKSLGNTIGITDAPEDAYGKIMSISDTLMLDYFDVLRDDSEAWSTMAVRRAQLAEGTGNPLAFKNALALGIVRRFHGADAAGRAAAHFSSVIGRKEVPEDLPVTELDLEGSEMGLLDLLRQLGLTRSNGEGRRLVGQGAVRLDGEIVEDPALRMGAGSFLLKVGKRRFARVQLKG